jgi:hypothetical protein
VLLCVNVLSIFVFLATKAYYVARNRAKDERWRAMTDDERARYLRESQDMGCRRLDFRFAH